MKSISLATLMALLASPAFSETDIAVLCRCSFIKDSIKEGIVIYGEKTNATKVDVENCVLEDGKVAPGTCWSAKGDVLINCANEAKRFFPDQINLPMVTIEEDACFGKVYND